MRTAAKILACAGGLGAGMLGLAWVRAAGCVPLGRLVGEAQLTAAYLLVAAMVVGCVGALLVDQRRGRFVPAALVAAGVAPGMFEPKAFVATFALVLAGLVTYEGPGAGAGHPDPRKNGSPVEP